ncbi:hypothetical protein CK203_088076 [Vitis vinifera]|uniref:Uncharacterized protein n=1 Tax=Vitis vinifera TaxID=29760 RepID=A0A438DBT5_VITVI|nr:hypothetical protein CK203_088076 [Vitis vinifera]
MMNPSSSFLGCKSPSQFSPFVGLEYDERLFEDLIYWGDMKRTVNESLAGVEEERLDLVKECAVESPLWDSIFLKGSFSKLASFIKFVELLVEGFEEEIFVLLRRLELRKKGKTPRQGPCLSSRTKGSTNVSPFGEKVGCEQVLRMGGVYGPVLNEERGNFSNELSDIRCLESDPWCVEGDFNGVRFPGERRNCQKDFQFDEHYVDLPVQDSCLPSGFLAARCGKHKLCSVTGKTTWVGLLAFHMALVNKPQDASVVWTLSSVLYHGKWTEGVKFARKHALAPISFSPEILVECDSKSDEELAERVSELASLVQDCAISSTKTGDLSASMSDYPDYPCTGLVFVQKRMAERVAHIFNVLVNGIESYEEGRESPDIDYYLLGKGDLRETRFVLGKVIMDTMSSELVQMGTEVLEEKNQLHMSYNEQKPEALEQDCHPILYEVVKHLVVAKEDKKRSLSSFNPELQQERGKKQKLVDIEFDPLEQEIAKENQKEKNNKHQEIAKKQEMAENEQHQEMAKKHLKMVGKENLQKSAKRQHKVAKNSHLPQQKLARKQNEQHKLEEAVNQKPSRPSLSSLFK